MSSQGTKGPGTKDHRTNGMGRLLKAFRFSCQGFKAAYDNEAAFRQEVLLAIVLVSLATYLGQSGLERTLLISVILLVPIIELINSGIEAIVDRVSPEQHELSGRAKDVASAAVLLSLVNAVVVWALVLLN